MTRQFELKKMEEYGMHIKNYPSHIYEVYDLICEKADSIMQEDVRDLAEMTYKEGFLDGLKFYSWIVDRTY